MALLMNTHLALSMLLCMKVAFAVSFITGCSGLNNGGVAQKIADLTENKSVAAQAQWTNAIVLDLPKNKPNNGLSKLSENTAEQLAMRKVYIQAVVAGDATTDNGASAEYNDQEVYRALKTALMAKDYQISREPDKVLAILQVRVKRAGIILNRIVQHALNKGYGAEILKPELNTRKHQNTLGAHGDVDNGTGITNYNPHPDAELYPEARYADAELNYSIETRNDAGKVNNADNVGKVDNADNSAITDQKSVGFKFIKQLFSRSDKGNKGKNSKALPQEEVFSIIADVQVLALQQDAGWLRQQSRVAVASNKVHMSPNDLVEALNLCMAKEIAALF